MSSSNTSALSVSGAPLGLDDKSLALLRARIAVGDPTARELARLLREIARDSPDITAGEADFLRRTVEDMHAGYRVFRGTPNVRKVTFFGSARTPLDHPDAVMATRTAALYAKHGWGIIQGAGPGIMQAAANGADEAHTYNIKINLPFEPARSEMQDSVNFAEFSLFGPRKVALVMPASALIVFPGGFGTLDELFEVITLVQTGKGRPMPIVLVNSPESNLSWDGLIPYIDQLVNAGTVSAQDRSLCQVAHTAEDAFAIGAGYYRNYHSRIKLDDGRLVIRVNAPVTLEDLRLLNHQFGALADRGMITRATARAVGDEEHLKHLDRITFVPSAQMRYVPPALIEAINTLPGVGIAHAQLGVAGNEERIAQLSSRTDWYTSMMNGEASELFLREQEPGVPAPPLLREIGPMPALSLG